MACVLRRSTTVGNDFVGKIGSTVTVELRKPVGGSAKIVHIRYGGDQLDETPPFQFTIRPGSQMLVVLVEASKAGLPLVLVEKCGGNTEMELNRFFFDPIAPGRGFFILGE